MTTTAPPPAGGPLERDGELALIAAAVRDAAGGAARLVVVEGPAGIGKTVLMGELRTAAVRAGMRTVTARGSELESEFPLGVTRQLFEHVILDPGCAHLLEGAAGPARTLVGDPSAAGPGADARFAMLHAVYWLTANLAAEGPLLVLVDDLHWADTPSLRVLAYLARRLEGLPVLLAVGLRPREPGADLALLDEMVTDPSAVVLRPAPLRADGAAALIRRRLDAAPDPAFLEACRRATGGNPLLLTELLRSIAVEGIRPDAASVSAVADIGPRAVSRAVLARLARLPAPAAAVARAAAVLGEGAELRHVAALAEVGADAAARATDALARAEILRPDPPVGFVHPLVRDAVYRDVTLGERERLHARAAVVLRSGGATDEQVAAQLMLGPRGGGAEDVDTLERAADAAVARGAAEGAAAFLRRALEERVAGERRTRLLVRLGLAEELTDGVAAVSNLRAAYGRLSDPVERARLALVLGRTQGFVEGGRAVTALAAEAAAGLGPGEGDLRRRLDALRLGMAFLDQSAVSLDDPGFAALRAAPPPERDPGALMLLGLSAVHTALTGGSAEAAAALALRALEGDVLLDTENGGVPHVAAYVTLMICERPEGLAAAVRALAHARRNGSLRGVAPALGFAALGHHLRGELEDAAEALDENITLMRDWGFRITEPFSVAQLAQTRIARGDVAGAREVLMRFGPPDHLPPSVSVLNWRSALMDLLVAEGDDAGAVALAERLAAEGAYGMTNATWFGWRGAVVPAYARLGRDDEGRRHAEEHLAQARTWGTPAALGGALRILGTLRGEAGLPLLDEAVSVLEPSAARLGLAQALAAKGAALRRARRPTDARDPLRRALELAVACGARGLADTVRGELAAAGVRPRTEALSGPAALTASERRVADLAAAGRSNRDIAQQLYVTAKTVELHLSSAYRKLGIRSRRELPAALGTPALGVAPGS